MRKITYGCLTLILLLLFLSGCGAQEANEAAARNTTDVTAAPASSEAADENAHDDGHGAESATPIPSPTDVVTPEQEPVETEEPKETEKVEATQKPKPAAKEKATEATPKATAAQPKPTPKTPVKTEAPIKDKPSDAVTVHTVEITNFAFSPEKLEISQGDIVTFINKDEVKHSATADNGEFDTELLAQNESMKVTFSDAGEFGYYCIPHPGMRGSIVVKGK
ncbi:plastocyanin/azurin family copper-binding protein [Paenibacillus sp. LHD-38]|uniref:cupredoxin domain-containing protein n=1 Tax=Paenibacillus sp. LHD-38 TaxID=3072143 RepID=UPI00280FA266|nr:plastocyanin/azurin family copper-binding protein [Paenibacillus sp. LHD-38]MDQ8734309.1 plastocyanin/azurin family copper-binding protein [Paenibacillus sp. LHD-38]